MWCIEQLAYRPGAFLTDGRILNVLEVNMALDTETFASTSPGAEN